MPVAYSACPCCDAVSIQRVMLAKDQTVSGKLFEIWECTTCSLRFTQSPPSQEEIGRYYQSEKYISHTDNKKGLINSLYHAVRKKTLKSKLSLIKKAANLKKGSILDIGAGTGAFLNTMKLAGWNTKGLEPDETARKNALELYNISLDSPEQLFSLSPESVDVITMWHVLEHVHNLHGYLQKIKETIKPSGKIFIAVPNYTSHDATSYKEYWAAYDVPRHLYHFSPKSMNILLEKHGLEISQMQPMWYDSFYVSMLSQQYKQGKGNVVLAGLIGLMSNIKAAMSKRKASSIIYIAQRKY